MNIASIENFIRTAAQEALTTKTIAKRAADVTRNVSEVHLLGTSAELANLEDHRKDAGLPASEDVDTVIEQLKSNMAQMDAFKLQILSNAEDLKARADANQEETNAAFERMKESLQDGDVTPEFARE